MDGTFLALGSRRLPTHGQAVLFSVFLILTASAPIPAVADSPFPQVSLGLGAAGTTSEESGSEP